MNPVAILLGIIALTGVGAIYYLFLILGELKRLTLETERSTRTIIGGMRTRQGHMSNAIGSSPVVRPILADRRPRKAAQRAAGAKTVLRGGEPK